MSATPGRRAPLEFPLERVIERGFRVATDIPVPGDRCDYTLAVVLNMAQVEDANA